MFEADRHRLAAVGHRTASERDEQIGSSFPGGVGAGDHGLARGVRGHVVVDTGKARAERRLNFGDFLGFAIERSAGQDKHALGAETVRFRDDGLRGGLTEYDPVHLGKNHRAGLHASPFRGMCRASYVSARRASWSSTTVRTTISLESTETVARRQIHRYPGSGFDSIDDASAGWKGGDHGAQAVTGRRGSLQEASA